MDDLTPSKIDLLYAESRIIFSICDCSLNKNYSFYGLNREEATRLLNRLRYIEKLMWKQFASLPRKNGLTPEDPGSENFNMISIQDSSEQQITGERYYFHFRVEETGLFRIFGYQKGQLFCITHIDPNGKINH
jgi:hypothetical protein